MFASARLKVERADKHIAEFEGRIDALFDSDSWRPFVELDNEDGAQVLRIGHSSLPVDLSPIIGDIFHNLRSALDLMYNELIRHFGGGPSDYTRFPFHGDRDSLISALNHGPIEAVSQNIRDFICDAVKPYRGGNDALFAIHDLNISDKHIALTPALSVLAIGGFSVTNLFTGETVKLTDDNRIVIASPNSGKEYTTTATIHTGYKLADYGDPVTDVVFGEGNVLSNEPIIPTVKRLSETVLRTIEDIAQLC